MTKKIPKHITLILNETDTIFLLEINSSIVPKDTEEGAASEVDNQLYDYLTKGKGSNRKVASIGIQTLPILQKTRHTQPIQYSFRDNTTFASNWEMYDTYNEQRLLTIPYTDFSKESDDENEEEILSFEGHKLIEEVSLGDLRKSQVDKEIQKLEANELFFDAALIIERLLANNCYNQQQKHFKGIGDDVSDIVKYNYKLDLLWTFSNEDTKSRCVTGISFNHLTDDLIAIGYGKYFFKDRKNTGVVMIWNIKNPKQPEREYYFQFPVTSLAFASKSPNHLAVGFYNGNVKLFDVTKKNLKIIGEDSITSFEPAWDILWLDHNEEEHFLVCFGDGRICKYRMTYTQLETIQILRLNKIEGKLRGLEAMRLFEGNQVSSYRYSSAITLTLHGHDPSLFLVATKEGLIHKCSVNYCTHHVNMFKAHEGSVHAIKFSPFLNKVYVTCGDDFQKCIWIEGIDEPLIRSRFCMEPVLDVEWSPSHSTILASLRGMDIFLWDFQRKSYSPQSQTRSPTNSQNTICRFTKCGRCLLVGDIDGNVHVFSVSGLPMPAFFQKDLFLKSLKNILLTNTDLTAKLEKLQAKNLI